ncbi:MAG: mechanosensitive ion channel family protein [Methanomicrobiales archaeon]|jgi:small-conductance mechanosensitive channel|nr:mechanosensitive ion channel family protein [Methanomicrobiales archaeon]
MDSETLAITFNILHILTAATVGILVGITFYFLVRRAKKRAVKSGADLRVIIYHAVMKPGIFLITACTILAVLRLIPLPTILAPLISLEYQYIVSVLVVAAFVGEVLYGIISHYSEYLREKSPDGRVENKLISFLELTIRYIIWAIALITILALLHVNITPLIAAGGFIGIGLTFAAQSILGNLFSGLILAADQPFKIGDRIQVQSYIGDVLTIGIRCCSIRTTDNRTVVIPNSLIEKDVVTNFSAPNPRISLSIPLKIPYGVDIDSVKETILDVVHDCSTKNEMILEDPKVKIYFQDFGQYCLNFTLSVWISNYAHTNDAVDFINTAIQKRFDEEGMNTPTSVSTQKASKS